LVSFFFLFSLYFGPSFVALRRHHHNATAIVVLNLLLGWTLIGWIGAMIWACTATNPALLPAPKPVALATPWRFLADWL
jgi:hypothetical protein